MVENRRRNIIIISIGVLVLAMIIWIATQTDKSYTWTETYTHQGAQPYDLGLFRKVLEESHGENFKVLVGLFADTSYLEGTDELLVIVDGYALFDSVQSRNLVRFVEKGNQLFISTNTAGPVLDRMKVCAEDSLVGSRLSRNAVLTSQGKEAELSFDRYNEPVDFSWFHFMDSQCGTMRGKIRLGEEELTNFLQIDRGKGSFYIHSTPLAFTNYHFRRKEVFEYVSQIIPETDGMVYYLEPGEMSFSTGQPIVSESPLRFLLAHPPLKWAWYLILLAALLYVLNAMRRKQRSVPVKLLPQNQTVAFVDMTYRLFSKDGRHSNIINSQYRLLLVFLRNKYGLALREIDEGTLAEASEKLKMKPEYLKKFFKELERSRYNSTLSDQELMELDQKITEFYLKCP